MKRYLIIAVVLLMAFLSSGCTSQTGSVEPSSSNSSSPKPTSSGNVIQNATPATIATDARIDFFSVHISPTNATFEARAYGIPDGTIFLSQLDGAAWWPSSQEFKVMNGHLIIYVELGKNGASSDLSAGHLRVWSKEHPEIEGNSLFDFNPPPGLPFKLTAYPDGASYPSGQVINTTISFTNISSMPFKISPFPSELEIRPFTSTGVIRHFAPGNDEVQLNAGETAKYVLTWDQKDDNGKQVDQGLYEIDAFNVKMSNTPQVWGGSVTTILIKSP